MSSLCYIVWCNKLYIKTYIQMQTKDDEYKQSGIRTEMFSFKMLFTTNITQKHTLFSQAVSNLLMKCMCCSSHDAHLPKWEGGMAVYFDNGWKILLPSLHMLHHLWAFAAHFSAFFLPEVVSWGSSAESHTAGQTHAGLRVPRQEAQFISFFQDVY